MEPQLVPVRCRVPELLRKLGKNQQWLAEVTGMSKQTLSDIVTLRNDNIKMKKAALIAFHLKCDIDDLYVWEWR